MRFYTVLSFTAFSHVLSSPCSFDDSSVASDNTVEGNINNDNAAVKGSNTKKFCSKDKKVCISSGAKPKCFDVESSAKGWVGFGIGGSTMKTADLYVGWTDTKGGITLGKFKADGYSQPKPNGSKLADATKVLSGSNTTLPGISYSFCQSKEISGSLKLIYAVSDKKPKGDVDSTSASFVEHDSFGSLTWSQAK